MNSPFGFRPQGLLTWVHSGSRNNCLLAFLDFKEYGLQSKTDITSTPFNYQTLTDCTWKGMPSFEPINCKVQLSQNRLFLPIFLNSDRLILNSLLPTKVINKEQNRKGFFILIKWNTINKFATTKKEKKWDILWDLKRHWRTKEQQENGYNSKRQRQIIWHLRTSIFKLPLS